MPTPKVPFATLLAELHDPAGEIRLKAIKKIVRRNSESQAFADLVSLISDPESRVRNAALRVLCRMGDARLLPILEHMLSNPKSVMRAEAARALGNFADAQAFALLLPALKDPSASVRIVVLKALIQLDEQRAQPYVLTALGDVSEKIRLVALMQLKLDYQAQTPSPVSPQTPPPYLSAATQDAAPEVRMTALRLLVQFFGREAVPYLVAAQKDAVDEVRWRALSDLLPLIEPRESIPHLLHALGTGNDPKRRRLVIGRLSTLGKAYAEVLPELFALTSHPDAQVREDVFAVLRWLCDPQSLPYLLRGLHDEHNWVRIYAVVALGELGDRQVVEDLLPMLADQATLSFAVFSLKQLNDVRAVEPLLEALRHANNHTYTDVRLSIIDTLRQLNDPRALGPLLETLSDTNKYVRDAAFWALGAITGKTQVFQDLWQAVSADEPDLRVQNLRAAVTALDLMI